MSAEAPAAAAAAAPAASSQPRNVIFVGGLSYSTRELTLARHIETVARVLDVHILTTFNNRSKGSAFVRLEDPSRIDEVVEKLNGKALDGRCLEITRAKPFSELPARRPRFGAGGFRRRRYPYGSRQFNRQSPARGKREPNPDRTKSEYTVAVLNLPFVAKEDDMNDIFEGFDIVESKICRAPNGMSRGIAFVTFISHEEQQRAIQTAHLNLVENRKIRVVEAFLLPEELEEEKKNIEEAKTKEKAKPKKED